MVVKYTLFDNEITYPGLFTYPSFLQGFLCDLILGLTFPGLFTYSV